jgi:hypothetical protein
MELLIPEGSFLPHDFEMWHIVLSNGFVSWNEEEDSKWEQWERSGTLTAGKIQREKERTWERIFDLANISRHPDWCCTLDDVSIAAVLEEITLDHVQKVDHFTAR